MWKKVGLRKYAGKNIGEKKICIKILGKIYISWWKEMFGKNLLMKKMCKKKLVNNGEKMIDIEKLTKKSCWIKWWRKKSWGKISWIKIISCWKKRLKKKMLCKNNRKWMKVIWQTECGLTSLKVIICLLYFNAPLLQCI